MCKIIERFFKQVLAKIRDPRKPTRQTDRFMTDEELARKHYWLADDCWEVFDIVGAIKHLRRSIVLDPAFAKAHCFLCRLLEKRGLRAELLIQLEILRSLESDNNTTTRFIADQLIEIGLFQRALEELKRIVTEDNLPYTTYLFARSYEGLRDWENAILYYEKAVEQDYTSGDGFQVPDRLMQLKRDHQR